jgi:PAS domain S-box-containing protein
MVNGKAQRLNASTSSNHAIQLTTQYLQKRFGNLSRIQNHYQLNLDLSGQQQYVQVSPWRDQLGLDWLVVVVIPKADFTEQINANTRTTILLCIAALFGSIGVGILTARWITKPILCLNAAAKDIAQGEWNQPIEIERSDEVGELAISFKTMAAHLHQYFTKLKFLNEALGQSERKLRGIFNQTFQFIGMLSPDGILLEVNQTALDFGGLQLGDVIGQPFWKCYWWTNSPETQTQLKAAIERAGKGEFIRYEVDVLGVNYHIFKIDFSLKPVFDASGKVEFIIPEGRDITARKQAEKILAEYHRTLETKVAARTAELGHVNELLRQEIAERKQTEEALQASQSRFAGILEIANDAIITVNAEQRITLFNQGAEKIFGYTADEVLGQSLNVLLPVRARRIHHQHLTAFTKSFGKARRMGDRSEIFGRRKDGTEFPAEASISKLEINGEKICTAILRDISDRKQTEKELRELSTALENAVEGISRLDKQGRYIVVNKAYASISGYQPEEMIGMEWYHTVHPDEWETMSAAYQEMLEVGKVEAETRGRRKDGSIFYKEIVMIQSCDEQYNFIGHYCFMKNITERKQAEEALRQAKEAAEAANLAKSAFLANMSHELRTPLNGILGYAQILQGDKNFTPKQKDGIGIIYQCGKHLLTLINDILDLSKIEAGKLALYSEDIYFPYFLAGVVEIFQLKVFQKEINFTYLSPGELPTVIHADEKRLRQVVMNLLSNAIKFTDIGEVTFKVEVLEKNEKSYESGFPLQNLQSQTKNSLYPSSLTLQTSVKIRFQVEDTGIGITPDQLTKIFLPFEQVGDNSRRNEGTGLGLAITQKIVEEMGGKVFVESTPQAGSTFWFDLDLPVVSTSLKPATVKSTDNIIGYSGEKRKILIVDDRWENCAVFTNILEPIGFELKEAADGQEGVEKALQFQPDLILVDLVMPVMDGYQMTQRIRQLPEIQHTIIIAISANAFVVDQQKSLQFGCNDFLPKPIQCEDLLDKIQSYLNLSWIYDHEAETKSHKLGDELIQYSQMTLKDMLIPPQEELFALYAAANSGYVNGVEEEVIRLQQLNPEYTPFVTQIMRFSEDFEYEIIVELLNGYLPKKID